MPPQTPAILPPNPDIQAHPPKKNVKLVGVVTLALVVLVALGFAFAYAGSAGVEEKAAAASAAAAFSPKPFASTTLTAKAAYVLDIPSGETLFSLNPDVQLPLASLTKIPLALVVAESMPLDSIITIPRDTASKGSAERLGKGEKWRVQDVIDFTLVASSNAGAEILAGAADAEIHRRYPQSPENGASLWRMNDLARQLHLTNTYFLNPSGLDVSTTLSGAYGSARDVAHLFAYAVTAEPDLFAGTASNGLLLTSVNGKTTSAFNTNESRDEIQGLILGKTGYTDLAGGNLAIVFDVGLAHPVVAVVLGSTRDGRFDDMQKLVAAARTAVTGR